MYKLLIAIFRKVRAFIPGFLQEWLFAGDLERLRKNILRYYDDKPVDGEEKVALDYLRNNKLNYYTPFAWVSEYVNRKIEVRRDSEGYYYVPFHDKRLYAYNYKGVSKKRRIMFYVNGIAAEMDINSPHRYTTCENELFGAITTHQAFTKDEESFYVKNGDVVADLGCAEGNFALSIIDIASHVYLFECDPLWIKDLERTFKDYMHKVTIVNKYVSNRDTATTVTLDTFFREKEINFIKADIEGAELKMLQGGAKLFAEKTDLQAAICTYHNPEDATEIKLFFDNLGYQTSFTKGIWIQPPPSPFRKAVIRAKKG